MSRLVTAGNVVIPGTITVTVNNSHITPLDDLRVILNITGAGAVTLDDGTDTTQRVEIMNKSATTCSVTYKDNGGDVTVQLATNKGARLLWVGGFWKCTVSNLITGTDMYGNPVEYLGEATIDTKVVPQQYTTTEQLTGEYWIDNKPIYRRVLQWSGTIGNELNVPVFSISSVDSIVHYEPVVKASSDTVIGLSATGYIPNAANYTAVIGSFTGDTLNIRVNNGGTNYLTIIFVQVILEYTKTTD